jgi:CHASE2 domain-containing sensor protein
MGAALAVLLGWSFLVLPTIREGLENLSYDWLFVFRPTVHPQEVVIVYMDEESHHTLGVDPLGRWPRDLHATLLKRLKAVGAGPVVFDILFHEPTTNDQPFIDAAKTNGPVFTAAKLLKVVHQDIPFTSLIRPFTNFARLGLAEGGDDTRTLRRHYAGERDLPVRSLAWEVASLARPAGLGNPMRERWINYYGPPFWIPNHSYAEILLATNLADWQTTFSNKVVFIGSFFTTGFGGGTGSDVFRTPYTRWTGLMSPGVEIEATTYLNLIRGDWLEGLPWFIELPLFGLLGLVFGYGLTRLRPLTAAGVSVGGAVLVFGAANGLTWGAHLWFPWAIVCLVQIPAALAWAVLAHARRLSAEKVELEERLAERMTPASPRTGSPVVPKTGPIVSSTPTAVVKEEMRKWFPSPTPPNGSGHSQAEAATLTPPPIPDHRLLRRIGAGAYGEVWLAQSVVGSYHAVKIVFRANFQDDRPYEREFAGICHFEPISRSHPGLVHLLHVGREAVAGYFYYVMELADDVETGLTVAPETFTPRTLAAEVSRRGKMPVDQCIHVGLVLTDALCYLHGHGLVHRDIKPSNIIFVDGKPKLADIGLVTGIGEGRSFVGTEGYYAPEGSGTPAGDLFSLGMVLYAMTTGFQPSRFPDLPTAFDEPTDRDRFRGLNLVILRACEREGKGRYQTARQMHADLVRLEMDIERKGVRL